MSKINPVFPSKAVLYGCSRVGTAAMESLSIIISVLYLRVSHLILLLYTPRKITRQQLPVSTYPRQSGRPASIYDQRFCRDQTSTSHYII